MTFDDIANIKRIDREHFENSKVGISVQIKFFYLAFFLFFCTPRVEIDGVVYRRYWGTHFFPLTSGKHKIRIYFAYLFMSRCGENEIEVDIQDNQIMNISYFMWPWVIAKGSLEIIVQS